MVPYNSFYSSDYLVQSYQYMYDHVPGLKAILLKETTRTELAEEFAAVSSSCIPSVRYFLLIAIESLRSFNDTPRALETMTTIVPVAEFSISSRALGLNM